MTQPDNTRLIYRANINITDYKKLLGKIKVQITPYYTMSARAFYLGLFEITTGARRLNIKGGEGIKEFPVFQNFFSDLWKPDYLINGVSLADDQLAEIYANINWGTVENITTDKFEEASVGRPIEVDDLETEYVMVELNQLGSACGILAKHMRALSYLSDSFLETGTGFGIFSRTILAGRPKRFVTCDPKKWFDSPDRLKKLSDDNGVDFEFFNGCSLDYDPKERFDSVFLDGNHDHDYLLEEINKFGQVVDKFIILHDANLPEVQHAIRIWLNNNKDWVESAIDIRAGGLLILTHKSQLIDPDSTLPPQMFF